MENSFPIGKPEYFFGQDINDINFEIRNNEIYFQNQRAHGLIQVALLCPSDLKNPFILIRNKDKRSVAPNCFTCGYKSLKTAQINTCKHSTFEKAIKGTYCLTEIEYALSLGYQILKVFSILLYKQSSNILHKYVSLLGFEKLKSSGYPSTETDKKAYCKYLNSKMNLKSLGLLFEPKIVFSDSHKREFAKLALNSFLGKFSQSIDKPLQKIVSSENEIAKYFYSKTYEITDIFCLNKFFCQIEVQRKRKTLLQPNLSSNCVIGAQIVALARQFMHKKMIELESIGGTLYYSDTDNLIFALKKTLKNPLQMSSAFGDFKYEIPPDCKIFSFYSLGPKNYSISYKDNNGISSNIVKLRGITLSNVSNKNIIDTSVYDTFLANALKKKFIQIGIPQLRLRSSKYTKTKSSSFQKSFFSNSLEAKRIIDKKSQNYLTHPFGYKKNDQ